MPIYNSKDLIPFVNMLESKIIEMNQDVSDWAANKFKLISSSNRVDGIYANSMAALVRADEAMSEIGTATFKSTAARGKRLEDTLNKLREEMYEIAENVEGQGGGGALTDGIFFDELNNAIASVDPTIEDGLKLDYRLREIQKAASIGTTVANKNLIVAYKYEPEEISSLVVSVPEEKGVLFVNGEVTVLNQEGSPILDQQLDLITGRIDEEGVVQLSAIPSEKVTLYFPVSMKFSDVPDDFLYLFVQQMVQKNSSIMEAVIRFESSILDIIEDIDYMKGMHWTPDFSIMKNHQDIVKEGITPKGLNVEVKDGLAHVTFSYNEHPNLDHFVLEKWDEELKQFVPYDDVNGVIQK